MIPFKAILMWLLVVIGAAVWLMLGLITVPAVIEDAYNGESIDVLNNYIANRPPRPLEYYTDKWERNVWAVLMIWCVGGTGAIVLTRPRFQDFWNRIHGEVPAIRPWEKLGKWRFAIVKSLIVLLVFATGVSMVSFIEIWPISPYTMYSDSRYEAPIVSYRLFGVPSPDSDIEIEFEGFVGDVPLSRLLKGIVELDDSEKQHESVDRILKRFEATRIKGKHDQGEVHEMRLYKYEWDAVDAQASDLDQPDHRKLIASATLTSSAKENTP